MQYIIEIPSLANLKSQRFIPTNALGDFINMYESKLRQNTTTDAALCYVEQQQWSKFA
jgi:hypothetical protein